MNTKRKRSGVEWIGGLLSMPAYVTGEGDPYRPEMLVWVGAGDSILGMEIGKPGELLGQASASLRATIAQPMIGRPHAPARVRVSSPELAGALRASDPALEVICAPTPELDLVREGLRGYITEEVDAEQSYLSPEIGPEAMASFFGAAAALFRAQPWKIVPSDQSIISVTIEKLGVRAGVISVIGQMGESLGVILFSGIDAFELFLDAAVTIAEGDEPTLPPHLALNFERADDLIPALRKEIIEHQWEVAGPDAYPWPVATDHDLVARPLTAADLTTFEAIAVALPRVLAEQNALQAAWNGGEPLSRTLSVRTHAGEFEVTLRIPYARVGAEAHRTLR